MLYSYISLKNFSMVQVATNRRQSRINDLLQIEMKDRVEN